MVDFKTSAFLFVPHRETVWVENVPLVENYRCAEGVSAPSALAASAAAPSCRQTQQTETQTVL